MSKVFECIYAYINNKSYKGEFNGEGIYTITKDLEYDEIVRVENLMKKVTKWSGIQNVDSEKGVKFDETDLNPNYELVSYAYYPTLEDDKGNKYKGLSRYGLSKSLKDIDVRWKEITHVIFFDNNDIQDKYVIDFLDNSVLKNSTDIYEVKKNYLNENEVYEKELSRPDPIKLEDFKSSPLPSDYIKNLKVPAAAVKSLSEIINAIFVAKKNSKVAYIVYNPNDWELATEYIKVALKLLPVCIANELSFITCYGKDAESIFIDICGVPTCDSDYISRLRKTGCLVELSQTGANGIDGEKVPFAAFLLNEMERGDNLQSWLAVAANYYEYVDSLDDINDVIKLYLNANPINNTDESIESIANSLVLINKFIKNKKLNDEVMINIQINSIKNRIKKLCAEIQKINGNKLYELYALLNDLYSNCKEKSSVENELVDMIRMVIFGLKGQGEQSRKKHFEILSSHKDEIMQKLKESKLDIFKYMETDMKSVKSFFDNYFIDNSDCAAEFSLGLLTLLRDIGLWWDRCEIRDYFISAYLSAKSDKLDEILEVAFKNSDTETEEVFNYVLDSLLNSKNNQNDDKELFKDSIKTFSNFLIKQEKLEVAIRFFINKFVCSNSDNADVVKTILGNLLEGYFKLPDEHTMDEICNGFKKVQSLIGSYKDNMPLKKFLYEDYAVRIINPIYREAIESVRLEEISLDKRLCYCNLAIEYNKFSESIDTEFCTRILDLFKKFEKYDDSQSEWEGTLVESRIDFVTRELSLLDKKTILSILNKYIDEDKVTQQFQNAGIEGEVQKSKNFIKTCETMARDFLQDSNNLSDKKQKFAEDVRKARNVRNRDGATILHILDVVKGIIDSTILAAVVAVLVAVSGYLLNNFYDNGYFKLIYYIFTIFAVAISEAMYWYNYCDKRRHNVILTTTWQTTVILIVMIGLYALMRFVLKLIF